MSNWRVRRDLYYLEHFGCTFEEYWGPVEAPVGNEEENFNLTPMQILDKWGITKSNDEEQTDIENVDLST